jgi:hypothetical protein
MNPGKKRERRIPELERDVLDDEEVRRLVRRGVLVPFDRAPRKPLDPAALDRLRGRPRIDDDDERPLLDHMGRGPDHFDYGSDD